jgi:hypothetical protein
VPSPCRRPAVALPSPCLGVDALSIASRHFDFDSDFDSDSDSDFDFDSEVERRADVVSITPMGAGRSSWLLVTGCRLRGCWPSTPCSLVVDHHVLVAGRWSLVAGCWLLVAGCWSLAAGGRWQVAGRRSPTRCLLVDGVLSVLWQQLRWSPTSRRLSSSVSPSTHVARGDSVLTESKSKSK